MIPNSRRSLLKSTALAAVVISQAREWTPPVVRGLTLPAHAMTSPPSLFVGPQVPTENSVDGCEDFAIRFNVATVAMRVLPDNTVEIARSTTNVFDFNATGPLNEDGTFEAIETRTDSGFPGCEFMFTYQGSIVGDMASGNIFAVVTCQEGDDEPCIETNQTTFSLERMDALPPPL